MLNVDDDLVLIVPPIDFGPRFFLDLEGLKYFLDAYDVYEEYVISKLSGLTKAQSFEEYIKEEK